MLDVVPSSAPAPSAIARGAALAAGDLAAVEALLVDLLGSNLAIVSEIGGHVVRAGGKRLRPLLTVLAARAAGHESQAPITIAAVGELIHTATLLHDDVVDGADFRRGRPAARHHFGNGLAVLTGDFCLARGLQAIARLGQVEAVQSLAETVAAMAEGEIAQLAGAGAALDRPRYYQIIDGKTASLLGWCASIGRLVPAALAAPLANFGREFGFAFQIADDVLDYAADPRATGKPRAQDLREGKVTLPLIVACERDRGLATRVQDLLRRGPPLADDEAHRIIDAVIESGAIEATLGAADRHAEAAIAHLSALPASSARDLLVAVTRETTRRSA